VDSRQGRHDVQRYFEIIDSGHGNILRHVHAARLRFEYRARRER
jgi:hypothetical protein